MRARFAPEVRPTPTRRIGSARERLRGTIGDDALREVRAVAETNHGRGQDAAVSVAGGMGLVALRLEVGKGQRRVAGYKLVRVVQALTTRVGTTRNRS